MAPERGSTWLRSAVALLVLGAMAWGAYLVLDVVRSGTNQAALRVPVVADRTSPSGAGPVEVVLWGDSLGWESRDVVSAAFADRDDVHFEAHTFGGTAPCDWLTDMAARAASVDVAAVQFSGNSIGNCMRDPATQQLPAGDAIVTKYRRDITFAAELLTAQGAVVVLVGSPPARVAPVGDAGPQLTAMYREVADEMEGVEYVDAGQAVLDHGAWTATLPCLPSEDASRGCANDRISVRAPDGVHLCPVARPARDGIVGACPVWSSGALRFGRTIADAIAVQVAAR
jgi:hypothetical protein